MFDYSSEAAFSKALVKALKDKGCFVQRIESGSTANGIPDIFMMAYGKTYWLELKRLKRNCCSEHETITWRPGQLAWLQSVNKCGALAFTIACYDDCILVIPMCKQFTQNRITPKEDAFIATSIQDVLYLLGVAR